MANKTTTIIIMEKETSLIKKVLTTEVKYILAIVAFVFGIANPYYAIKQDIALMQKDISTINANMGGFAAQDILAELKDQKQEIASLQGQVLSLSSMKK